MANGLNSNVRFYKLNVLPPFDVSKYVGIFVHVTTGDTTHKAGLWFGGATGWEYLTNDTTPESITNAINALDVDGYAQATITPNISVDGGKPNSTLTILGIKEVDGKISNDSSKDFEVAIDGKYDKTDNKIATQSTVTTAIKGLKVEDSIQAVTKETSGVNTVLTFKGIKEADGVILQGTGNETLTVGDAKLNIEIGSDSFEVFSANAKENKSIYLNKNVFKKDVVEGKNVLSIYTTEGVSSTNPLVTQNDINGLAGAMHYRGGVTSLPTANENTKKGDVWIVTTAFDEYEVGDMFIARADGGSATFDTVQGNLTLGTGIGKVAANSAALSKDKIVVASENGIETIDFDKDNLTGTTGKNERTLSITSGIEDNTFHHAVTITDTFKVIGKDFNQSINISSNNRSIDIANNANTGVVVDLVWNTSIE